MITSAQYDLLKFKKPNFSLPGKIIPEIIGCDTEADITGKPFLCCFSNRETVDLKYFPDCFFDIPELVNGHVGVYNLKYESGAFIYHFPKEVLIELWENQKVDYRGFTIEYIPKKAMIIKRGKETIYIWDIYQYYKMSLEKASSLYLDKHKTDIETKIFDETYIRKYLKKITEYCFQDAILCAELGNFLLKKMKEFGVRVTALYSGASLSLRYYSDRGKICNAYRYYRDDSELLKMAIDVYAGGKFECTQRGYFDTIYEYDLTSAYPAEIMKLLDLSMAKTIHDKRYVTDAVYGYMLVVIDNSDGYHLSCGVKKDGLMFYPAGVYRAYCTKAEYEYMVFDLDIDVTILDAFWIMIDFRVELYRRTTNKIFALKKSFKNKDTMLYNVSKVMANSFYGKTVQVIKKPDELYYAGSAFNPLHGAVITANNRLKVTKLQNEYKDDVIAVHTDSVMMKRELDEKYLDGKIGSMEYVDKGECILVACGMYMLGKANAYRGFQAERVGGEDEDKHFETWREILERSPNSYNIVYPVRKTESWIEAVSKGHFGKINLFYDDKKTIDLNCDRKRIWPKNMKAKDFLCKNQNSIPMIYVD